MAGFSDDYAAEDLADDIDSRKIIVRLLDENTTRDTIQGYFSAFGAISDVDLKIDEAGKSRGFCFITFTDGSVIDKLVEQTHIIDNKEVVVARAIPYKDRTKTNKLFVGGLPESLSEEEISEFFDQFGTIEKIETVIDQDTQRRKHFCFIVFTSTEAVEKAVNGKNPPRSVVHKIGKFRLECRKKFPEGHPIQKKFKEMRKQQMEIYPGPSLDTFGYSYYGYSSYGYPATFQPTYPHTFGYGGPLRPNSQRGAFGYRPYWLSTIKVASDDRFGSCRIAHVFIKLIFAIELEGDDTHSLSVNFHEMGLDCLFKKIELVKIWRRFFLPIVVNTGLFYQHGISSCIGIVVLACIGYFHCGLTDQVKIWK